MVTLPFPEVAGSGATKHAREKVLRAIFGDGREMCLVIDGVNVCVSATLAEKSVYDHKESRMTGSGRPVVFVRNVFSARILKTVSICIDAVRRATNFSEFRHIGRKSYGVCR
jgi:hypothetical protein